MACRVRSVRHSAILDTANVLMNENPEIDSLGKVIDWFATNYPNIQRQEIIDAFVIVNEQNVDASKKVLKERKNTVRQEARWANKLDNILTGLAEKHHGVSKQDSPALKQIKDAVKKFQDLAKKDDLTQDDIDTTISMLE